MPGMRYSKALYAVVFMVVTAGWLQPVHADPNAFDPHKDLLSLHYDHAPDRDDGQSVAADFTILSCQYGNEWLADHVLPVSGTCGVNAAQFNPASDRVMDTVWNGCGGWVAAHEDWFAAVDTVFAVWRATLLDSGDIWVKEGGQSDLTAQITMLIRHYEPDIDTRARIHVVQHSDWNENTTEPSALAYTIEYTDYIRILDANSYLNELGGDRVFEQAAVSHPTFGAAWKAAFEYYPPGERLDFSDTGELMHILGLGQVGIDAFRRLFLISP